MKKILFYTATCFLTFLCLVHRTYAQQEASSIKINGTVVDARNRPVEGVTVATLTGDKKVVTAQDGKFQLEADKTEYITFSKNGFLTRRLAAPDVIKEAVVLNENLADAGSGDDVYIPFGVRKTRQVSSAISVMKGDNAPQVPFASLTNIFNGRVPGLYVAPVRTDPGNDAANLLIRGRSSYNDAQAPLILVDGIERDFSDMDINEVESISVLKDASALAWYGIRAANGVLFVTTRTGNPGKMKITLDAMGGVQMPQYLVEPINSFTYASLYNEALQNDGFAPLYSQTALDGYKNGTDLYAYPNNNFVDRFIKSSAPIQRYVGTISGGNAAVRYFTSFSYFNQSGLFEDSKNDNYNSNAGYQRYNFRSNITAAVTSDLEISLNIGGRVEDRRQPTQLTLGTVGVDSFMRAIYFTPPNAYPLLNRDSSYGGTAVFTNNPLGLLKNRGYSSQVTRVLLASSTLRYKMDRWIKGLSANILYSYDYSGLYQSGRNENFDVYQQNITTGAYTRYGGPRSALAYSAATFSGSVRNNELWAGFDYARNFGQHDIDMSLRYNTSQYFNPVANARFDFNRKGVSYRASYGYGQRYYADLVLNYSGNNWFAPDNRYGFFPAVSAAWVIADETLTKKSSPLNYLKLRASYGSTGSESLYGARLYGWEALYNTIGIPSYSFGTGFASAGSATAESSLPNSNLGFERSNKFNVGIDAKLFSRVLNVTFDVFTDQRKNLISPSFTPGFIGQTLVPENNGTAEYKGFETSLSYYKEIGRLSVNLFVNYTYTNSNLKEYNDRPGLPENQRQQGHPVSNYGLLYEAIGIFQTQDEIDKSPRQTLTGVVRPGDVKYKDVNDDGLIDGFDRSVLDYSLIPKGYYGFGTTLKFAGLDMSVVFNGQHGGYVNISPIVNAGNSNNGFLNQYSVDRWTTATANTALWPRLSVAYRANNTAPSTFWLRSSDFMQLRSVELGYTVPVSMAKKLKIESLRFYVNGYNLANFGGIKDLKVSPDIVSQGLYPAYPYLAMISGGINLKF